MAVRQDDDAVTLTKGLGDTDGYFAERCVECDARPGPARETKADRPAVRRRVSVGGPDHLAKLGLIFRRHERHTGEDA